MLLTVLSCPCAHFVADERHTLFKKRFSWGLEERISLAVLDYRGKKYSVPRHDLNAFECPRDGLSLIDCNDGLVMVSDRMRLRRDGLQLKAMMTLR